MKRSKHLQNLMVAGTEDVSSRVNFLVSHGGKRQFVVSTGFFSKGNVVAQ